MIVATNYLRFFLIAVAATAVVHGQGGVGIELDEVVAAVENINLDVVTAVGDVQLDIKVDVEIEDIVDIVVGPLYPLTEFCNPCILHDPIGASLPGLNGCADFNPIVAEIMGRDSSCGRKWDDFCLVKYNDCYNQACGADQQAFVDEIVANGGPNEAGQDPRGLNRDQILKECPLTPQPTPRPIPAPSPPPTSMATVDTVEPTVCPPGKGGKGGKGGKKGGYYGGKGGKGGKKGYYGGKKNGDCYYGGKKTGKKGYYGGKKTGKKGYYVAYYDDDFKREDSFDYEYGGKKGYYYYGGKKGYSTGFKRVEDIKRVDVIVVEKEVEVAAESTTIVAKKDVTETVIDQVKSNVAVIQDVVNTNVAAIQDFVNGNGELSF